MQISKTITIDELELSILRSLYEEGEPETARCLRQHHREQGKLPSLNTPGPLEFYDILKALEAKGIVNKTMRETTILGTTSAHYYWELKPEFIQRLEYLLAQG